MERQKILNEINAAIRGLEQEIARLDELKAAKKKEIRAYRKALRSLGSVEPGSLEKAHEEPRLLQNADPSS